MGIHKLRHDCGHAVHMFLRDKSKIRDDGLRVEGELGKVTFVHGLEYGRV